MQMAQTLQLEIALAHESLRMILRPYSDATKVSKAGVVGATVVGWGVSGPSM